MEALSFLHDYATSSNDIDNVDKFHFLSQLLHRQARVTADAVDRGAVGAEHLIGQQTKSYQGHGRGLFDMTKPNIYCPCQCDL
jgi:hypothetical protein